MPKIIVRGGSEYNVDFQRAKKIKFMRWGDVNNLEKSPPMDRRTPIEIDGDCFELGEIKTVSLKDDHAPRYSFFNIRTEEIIEKNKLQEERLKKISSLDKTKRIIKNFCQMLAVVRQNSGGIVFKDPLVSKLMGVIFEYFEKNQEETHCPREVYQDLIPYSEPKIKGVAGFKSFAQVISEK